MNLLTTYEGVKPGELKGVLGGYFSQVPAEIISDYIEFKPILTRNIIGQLGLEYYNGEEIYNDFDFGSYYTDKNYSDENFDGWPLPIFDTAVNHNILLVSYMTYDHHNEPRVIAVFKEVFEHKKKKKPNKWVFYDGHKKKKKKSKQKSKWKMIENVAYYGGTKYSSDEEEGIRYLELLEYF